MENSETKKPKIVIVGVGNAASNLIEFLDKNNNSDNIKLVSVGDQLADHKFSDKVTKIQVIEEDEITMEEAEKLCNSDTAKERLENMKNLMQDGDMLFNFAPYKNRKYFWRCVDTDAFKGIRLTRDSKVIDSFKYRDCAFEKYEQIKKEELKWQAYSERKQSTSEQETTQTTQNLKWHQVLLRCFKR